MMKVLFGEEIITKKNRKFHFPMPPSPLKQKTAKSSASGDEISPSIFSIFHVWMHELERNTKRIILAVMDTFLYGFAIWLAYFLRLGETSYELIYSIRYLILFTAISGVLVNWMLRFYNSLIRAFEFRTVNVLASCVLITGLLVTAFGYIYNDVFLPRSVPIIFILLSFLLIGSSRVVARWYYQISLGTNSDRKNVLIYGAGDTGNHVASILSGSPEFSLVGFIDDEKSLQGNYLRGRKIYSLENLDQVIRRYGNVRVLLSISKLTPRQKRTIIQKLEPHNIEVDVVPSLRDVVAGRSSFDDIREIRIEDLLGREIVPPIKELFSGPLENQTVLISGAGGSIGSELCAQVIRNNPKKLVLLDQSELALYQLEQMLVKLQTEEELSVSVSYRLADVCDEIRISQILGEENPDIVYHAAAYKHVPIIEFNLFEGLKNNILGTWNFANLCRKANVARFIFVSTDKAVRPTNIMGATKRVAELVIQGQAQKESNTIFTMVRFGNVLGSSGSVIPLFRNQIESGGPVTITHEDVTRYFMTIPEAAQLVIQAGFLAKGGDLFLLDMGTPIKIKELAILMIQLSGKTIISADNPNGNIALEYTGLRPGEKLYEELLIGSDATGTTHPKILVAGEEHLSAKEVEDSIKMLSKAIQESDQETARKMLETLVDGFEWRAS